MSREVDLGQIVPNIQVGTTTTGSPSTPASVVNVGTDLNPIFNFTIPKGEPGTVHMIVVQTLPTEDIDESAIYLVPLENPTEEGNNYAEYVYINNQWELLGKIGVQVDLTDYALKSELPTALSQLNSDSTHRTVSDTEKSTWNSKANTSDIPDVSNFITKDVNNLTYYYNKTYIDNLVGDIDTALDSINGEVIS